MSVRTRNGEGKIVTPTLGVACITKNRASSLRRMLTAVFAQKRLPDRVVVVDNGSTDDTAAVIAGFPSVERVSAPGAGFGELRKISVETCRTDRVAMCDDDCVPVPEWTQEIERAFASDETVGIVAGAVINHGFEGDARFKGRGRMKKNFAYRLVENPEDATNFGNANLAVDMRAYRAAGGYDPRMYVGMEELDLVAGVKGAGFRLLYVAAAICHHHNEKKPSLPRLKPFDTAVGARIYLRLKHEPPHDARDWAELLAYEMRYAAGEIWAGVKEGARARRFESFAAWAVPAVVDRALLPLWIVEARRAREKARARMRASPDEEPKITP